MQTDSNKVKQENSTTYKGDGYWYAIKKQFKNSRASKWSLRILIVLLFIALFSDFIANEKPLYCQIDGATSFPVFKDYLVKTNLTNWPPQLLNIDWRNADYDKVIFAPVPYSATTMDLNNTGYKSPFDQQKVKSKRFWHWLGTDKLGRDTLAGMISGTRTAMLVGVIAMSIATIIGLFFGTIAGYFGDEKFKLSRAKLLMNIIAFLFAIFFAFIARQYIISEGNTLLELLKSLLIFILVFVLFNLLAKLFEIIPFLKNEVKVPLDILVMRLIEVVNSIPGLLFLLALLAIIKHPSILYVMLFIGLLRWTGIARFVRAELLRIRNLKYIEATQAFGFDSFHIILKHAIPNAITPVLITLAFGIASAILVEAFLSFLGIGVGPEEVTWGSMLSHARTNFSAWWLAIFPGIAIFITVTIFNLIGEGLTNALSRKA